MCSRASSRLSGCCQIGFQSVNPPSPGYPTASAEVVAELWTNAASGFPVPVGCSVSAVYADPSGLLTEGATSWRALRLHFPPRGGLRDWCETSAGTFARCEYMVVVHAAASVAVNDELVEVSTECVEGCSRPYFYPRNPLQKCSVDGWNRDVQKTHLAS